MEERAAACGTTVVLCLAVATVIAHLATGGRYGFDRDELATLDDARRLAWGYVAYPPITPFFGRLSLELFGESLRGFRFFAVLAEAVAVVVTAYMARTLGGRRGAQVVSALAAVPFCIAGGALMQYVLFDYLCWVLTEYFVMRLLASGDPRWWIAIGSAVGLGMNAKYGMVFLIAGILGGMLLTNTRRYFGSKWLWCGVAIAFAVFLPNLVWQARHDFVSLDFLRHIHDRDVRIGRTRTFLPEQLEMTLFAFPLATAGLSFYFSRAGRRFRMLGWLYVIPLVLFVVGKGRGYYLAAAYPMLYAAGAVWGERRLAKYSTHAATSIRVAAYVALAFQAVLFSAIFLPMAPVNSPWWRVANNANGDLREEIGWPELVQTVANIRDSLPPAERARARVLTGNYGEAGAIDLYGPRYGLAPTLSLTNSYWYRGYGDPAPDTLILVGFTREFADHHFNRCEVAGHTWNQYGIANEETEDHPDIFVCHGLRGNWPDFWNSHRRYG